MTELQNRSTELFNSPLEIGLRTLYILNESKTSCDLQRLVYYDYLLVHSGDAKNAPESIHPNTPHRSSEILVKRELIKNGLTLMASKQLVEFDFTKNGISYKATDLTSEFLKYLNSSQLQLNEFLYLKYLNSDYALQLSSVAKWLVNNFEEYNDDKLETYIKLHMDVWGGEFTKESLLRGQTQL